MDPNRWKQIDELVDAALDLPENERDAFIALKADGDEELRRAVSDLLGAQGATDNFLQHSAMKIVARAIADDEPTVNPASFLNTTIATYRIEKLLGAGGMGEVYLAFDEKMKRNVALKILPAEFISNDERVRRFEIEARAISSINHPNIVTIYDVGNFEGINYIATEFVEGKTLRDLIGGKFKLRNVMANSIQICDALSAAHEKGIIHRDIKPENIMIRKDGYAKILDFGVAKLTEIGPQTIGTNTTKGMIIGTPAYMSPAQVSGDDIDHRTDIWSCGVVLYEFITGKNPFKGANRQATFQAILSEPPALCSSLNPELPEDLDHILIKALEKDPDLGYQTASDLRADLKRVKRELDSSQSWTHSGGSSAFTSARRKKGRIMTASIAAVAFLGIATAVWALFFRNTAVSDGPDWSAATRTQLTDVTGTEYFPTISPDGKNLVYAADNKGSLDLFLLRIGGKNARNLTEGVAGDDTQPAFSPDGERIAFRSSRTPAGIYVMGATGENVRRVSDFGFHPSWSPSGYELVVSKGGRDLPDVRNVTESELWIINVASGERRLLIKNDAMQPAWSPDGHKIAYWFYPPSTGRRDVAVIPAAGGVPIVITKDGTTNWNPVWTPDGKYLYFASDRGGSMSFWRVTVDENGSPTSEPHAVVTPSKYSRHLAFSADGKRLAFVSTDNKSNLRAVAFDPATQKMSGEPFWVTQGDRQVSRPELSPDGTRFVYRLPRRSQDDIVVVNRDGTNEVDITNDASFDRYPRWSPDGSRIAFTSDRTGTYQIHLVNADGTNLRQLTGSSDAHASFPIWSPDGTQILYRLGEKNALVDTGKSWDQQTPVELPSYDDPKSSFLGWDWSSDGSRIAGQFSGNFDGNTMRIGYYSVADRRFVPLIGSDHYPMWLSGNRKMLYGVGNTIMQLDVETGKTSEILKTSDNISGLGAGEDGTLIYFVALSNESDIWLLDAK